MARCYSGNMSSDQPLPNLWLLSDLRNDARLELALAKLPKGSGFVFRHYHLDSAARQARYAEVAALCRDLGHVTVVSGSVAIAADWGADGAYGSFHDMNLATEIPGNSPPQWGGAGGGGSTSAPNPHPNPSPTGRGFSARLLRLATAHNAHEIAQANAAQVDGLFLSPVFPTLSHPGTAALGPKRFRELAAQSRVPIIALGGMTAERAAELDWSRWGAIDGHMPKTP